VALTEVSRSDAYAYSHEPILSAGYTGVLGGQPIMDDEQMCASLQ